MVSRRSMPQLWAVVSCRALQTNMFTSWPHLFGCDPGQNGEARLCQSLEGSVCSVEKDQNTPAQDKDKSSNGKLEAKRVFAIGKKKFPTRAFDGQEWHFQNALSGNIIKLQMPPPRHWAAPGPATCDRFINFSCPQVMAPSTSTAPASWREGQGRCLYQTSLKLNAPVRLPAGKSWGRHATSCTSRGH